MRGLNPRIHRVRIVDYHGRLTPGPSIQAAQTNRGQVPRTPGKSRANRGPCANHQEATAMSALLDAPSLHRGWQKIALPVAATATKVSSAAEEQKEHNDNQKQFHWKPPLE
jgi:hypothetical protein